jgi:hypothetical protein
MIEHHKKRLILEVKYYFLFRKKNLFYEYIGAKVVRYDDPKYGPSLELTWAKLSNEPKHYHVNEFNVVFFFLIESKHNIFLIRQSTDKYHTLIL